MKTVMSFESKNGSVSVSQVNGKYIVAVKNLSIVTDSLDAASIYFSDFVSVCEDIKAQEDDVYGV